MTITYILEQDLIKIEAPEIVAFITDIADYSTISMTGTRCSSTAITISYDTTEILNINSKFFIVDEVLYVRPSFFSLSVFTDSVYKFSIKFSLTDAGYTLIENCAFVDITFKCKVAAYLKDIIEENADLSDNEKVSTIIHLMHYSLVNGSNCGCNCSQMCEVFTELKKLLDNIQPENTNCGC